MILCQCLLSMELVRNKPKSKQIMAKKQIFFTSNDFEKLILINLMTLQKPTLRKGHSIIM